ncbi:MAG TPA: lytic transglycosylase domain-containing protein [Candidatus Polarisedimenticolia bacterium]|nr:lytic transglycosylase domain-containing protein [Candidatus Polarisedimenticolia bacterium]
MTRARITIVLLVAGTWFSLPTLSHAQIASVVNDRGKLVFVNGDSTKTRRGSTISSRPTRSETSFSASVGSLTVPGASFGALNGGVIEPGDRRLDRIVSEAAQRHHVDPELVKAVISTESGWNPYAVSRKGAMGLMQLVPATAERFGVGNPYDPAQNVEGGTAYLKSLLDRYNGDLTKSLAAYNAGERAVDQSGGVPAFPETRRYVQKVTNAYFGSDSGPDSPTGIHRRRPVRREVEPDGRVVFTNE